MHLLLSHIEPYLSYKTYVLLFLFLMVFNFIRNSSIRLVRDGIVVHEGELGSLQRFKDSVKEVNEKYECGMTIEKFNDIKVGDVIEAYTMEEIPR